MTCKVGSHQDHVIYFIEKVESTSCLSVYYFFLLDSESSMYTQNPTLDTDVCSYVVCTVIIP